MIKKLLVCAAICALFTNTSTAQNAAVINFTANVDSYSGVDSLNPFTSGTITNDLVNGNVLGAPASSDWLRFNGQAVIKNYTGDGVYTITPDGLGDGGIFLHNPLLNRVETETWRTEGGLTAASLAAGGGVFDTDPTQNRDDIYLPDFTPNGTLQITVSGNETSVAVDYLLDFNTVADSNAQFFRDGTTPTNISDILLANNAQFESIGINGSASGSDVAVSTATIGVDDEDIPFGVYFNLDSALDGNLSNTVADLDFFGDDPTLGLSGALTRGIIRNELAAGNITSDGRLASDPSTATTILSDPFVGESGTVTFFDLNGGPDFSASIVTEAIPEPSSAILLVSGLGALFIRRRR